MKISKNGLRVLVVTAIIFVVFNVIAFVAPFNKNGTFWTAYIFGLISILVQPIIVFTACKNGTDTKSKFYGFPIIRIGLIYIVVQFIFSLIFMGVSGFIPVWIPIILFVILLAFCAIGFIATDTMREEIEKQDIKAKVDTIVMRSLQAQSKALVGLCNDAEVKRSVEALAESFRFSDPVSSNATSHQENELANILNLLQSALTDNDSNSSIKLCKRAEAVLEDRNRLCKLNK